MGALFYVSAIVGVVPWSLISNLFNSPRWLKIALIIFQFFGLVGLIVNLIRMKRAN